MPITGDKDGLVPQLLEKLETLSSRLSKTIVVTSGRRTGDVSASAHNSGIAADFYVSGLNSISLCDEIVDDGFTGVGEYYQASGDVERFAHADIRGLPGSESSGAYAPGGSKSAPTCWYRVGDEYTFGQGRKSGRRCPGEFIQPTDADNVDTGASDSEHVRVMRSLISTVVDDLDSGSLDNKKRFMLHVAWHEGAFLRERRQIGGGPGRSFFQMEPPRSWDAYEHAYDRGWVNRLAISSGLSEAQIRTAALELPRVAGSPWPTGNQIEVKLLAIDLFGTYMARIALKRISNPVGPTNEEHAMYWADHWKIDFPGGDREELIRRFKNEADQVDRL